MICLQGFSKHGLTSLKLIHKAGRGKRALVIVAVSRSKTREVLARRILPNGHIVLMRNVKATPACLSPTFGLS